MPAAGDRQRQEPLGGHARVEDGGEQVVVGLVGVDVDGAQLVLDRVEVGVGEQLGELLRAEGVRLGGQDRRQRADGFGGGVVLGLAGPAAAGEAGPGDGAAGAAGLAE